MIASSLESVLTKEEKKIPPQRLRMENLIWAPNAVKGQHNTETLEKIVDGLKKIEESGGDYDDIIEALELFGLEATLRM